MHTDQHVIDIHLSYFHKFTAKVKKKIKSCKEKVFFFNILQHFLTSLFLTEIEIPHKKIKD